jgi:hypothetical protein
MREFRLAIQIVKALVEHGAHVNTITKAGDTPRAGKLEAAYQLHANLTNHPWQRQRLSCFGFSV